MAFIRSGWRGIGGYNRSFQGGQQFSYVNVADTVSVMKAESYFDAVQKAVHEGDIIWLRGTNSTDYVEVIRPSFPVTVSAGVPISPQTGITAGTTQTQAGGTVLISHANFVDTVGTTGDAVTLPIASVAQRLEVFNRGVNDLECFPEVGDNINNAAVNVSTTITANNSRVFTSDGVTNWQTH